MARPPLHHIDGILLVDKAPDWTSHDVVSCVRRRFNLSKTGHCGTLDPLATGLLVLLLGRATKWQERLMSEDKVYAGTLRLGIETDSQDRTGKVTATADPSAVTEEQLCAAASRFLGEQLQTPPMVSALKKDGRPLYELARQGKVVKREPRRVHISRFDLTRIALPEADFLVHCSKGTYIRTLCADVGQALGCGAHMSELRRLGSGAFHVENATSIEAVKAWTLDDLLQHVIPLEQLPSLKSPGEHDACRRH
ncbi:MAG TPA: tRNA pseudouridine(55) synthase TruB [Lentisphaeria bacterium]|nr:tRNA pseudouridine(55) synthase TruB [Lentisphaeria bacterium]